MRFIRRAQKDLPEELRKEYAARFIKPLVGEILYSRDIGPSEASSFISPKLEDLHDPFLFSTMRDICERIRRAERDGEYVAIYGDYDCDGICSSVILKKTFDELGIRNRIYIPDRFTEGYGANRDAFAVLIEEGVTLIITVDCGIRSVEEVRYAREKGVDVIVTDHHEPDDLPDTPYILNPKVRELGYPFDDLCGAGTAFKLSQALMGDKALENIDLAGIATIADMVKLRGENRIIAYYGLEKLNRKPMPGIKALIDTAGIKKKVLSSYNVGFNLAPRINAAGRMAHADAALETILEEDYEKAIIKAYRLDELNRTRQTIQEKIIREANRYIEENINVSEKRVILVKDPSWHKGILGLAAASLSRRYNRPVMVFNEEDGILTGSARSIDDINLYEGILSCSDLFLHYGGHSKAAGVSLHAEDFDELDRRINGYFMENTEEELFVTRAGYDFILKSEEIDDALVEQLGHLEPYGEGNPEPVFLIDGFVPGFVSAFGPDKKYRKAVEPNCELIYFAGEKDFSAGNRYTLTGTLSANEFRGNVTNTFTIRDINIDPSTEENVLRYKEAAFANDFLTLARNSRLDLDESVTEIEDVETLRELIKRDLEKSRFGTAVFVDSVAGLRIAYEDLSDLDLDREVLFYSNFSNNMICFSKPTEEPRNYHSIYIIGGFEPPMEDFDAYRVYVYRGRDLSAMMEEEYGNFLLSPEELSAYRREMARLSSSGFENMRELLRILSGAIPGIDMKKLSFAVAALRGQGLMSFYVRGRIFPRDNAEKSLIPEENPVYNLFV